MLVIGADMLIADDDARFAFDVGDFAAAQTDNFFQILDLLRVFDRALVDVEASNISESEVFVVLSSED